MITLALSGYFSVKCKRCGTVLETSIHQRSTSRELDMLTHSREIKCPRCHFAATYDPKDFFLGR